MISSNRIRTTGIIALLVVTAFLGTIRLERVPPTWWDEGWNFTIARNWVEKDYYGRFLAGTPIPATPTNGFPVVAFVALGFKLFGFGIWQARVFFTLFSLVGLMITYHVATQLYGRSVGIGAIFVLILMSPFSELHPILMGHQALGDIPAIFFLLTGYMCFLLAEKKSLWLIFAALFWAVAMITKLQVLPFWLASLLAPLALCVYKKSYQMAVLIVLSLISGFIVSRLLLFALELLIGTSTLPAPQLKDLYRVTALVTAFPARLFALIVTFEFGIPTLLGLSYGLYRVLRGAGKGAPTTYVDSVTLALLVLAGSWFVWYLTLSVGWVRYLLPATFIGSIFVAAMLHDLTGQFDLAFTFSEAFSILTGNYNYKSLGALVAILIVATSVPRSFTMLYRAYVLDADASVYDTARFINTHTAANALVETYDSELFFLLRRRYHYPPDQLHVDLVRRTFLYDDQVSIAYDPLLVKPDILIVGPHSKQWHLYDPVLNSGAFRLLRAYKRYDIYERVIN